jgi:hypothetical protein
MTSDVECVAYPDCPAGGTVELYRIVGGGHTWPGAIPVDGTRLGPTSATIDATGLVLAFLRRPSPGGVSATGSTGGELVVGIPGKELRRPAVVAVVLGRQEAPQPVVQPRRTDLVTRRGAGHLAGHLRFHLSIIGIAIDFVENDL